MIQSYISHSEDETAQIASDVANQLKTGQIMLIEGTLGAGKSFFARALIRALCNDQTLTVPSPTFTLCQQYGTPIGDLWHYDLYRLKTPEEVYETGWEDVINQDIVIVEWPDKLEYLTPLNATIIQINIQNNSMREIIINNAK